MERLVHAAWISAEAAERGIRVNDATVDAYLARTANVRILERRDLRIVLTRRRSSAI